MAAITAVSIVAATAGDGPVVAALDNTPWTVPVPPPRCTKQQADSGDVGGCSLAFYEDPATTGWGVPPAPGVGTGWVWSWSRYNGSPALATWEATYIARNAQVVGGLRAGTLQTHVAAQALFEGFLDEITFNGYRVRDASGYSFRCTAGSGGWNCPSGDPDDLSNHAWGLAIDMNSGTNPIRSYSSIGGVTACQTPIQTDFPQWVIQTAERWGLYWGGYGWNAGCLTATTQRTSVERDAPHFEFRGTPVQAAAIAAFNLHNDPNAVCRQIVTDAGQTVESCSRNARPEAGMRLPVDLDPPAGAVAALINLTATDATAHGYLTLEDCGPRSGERATSALSYAPGDSVAAMAIVPLSSDGRFCVYRRSPVHSIVDVAGYIGSDGQPLWYEPVVPTRLTDTRLDGACAPGATCMPPPLPPGTEHSVPTETGQARIVNLTAVDANAPGYLQVGRCADVGGDSTFSNLNVSGRPARANLALIPAGDSGTCAFSLSSANVIVDELGRLSSGGGLGWKLMAARRVIDTRQCGSTWCGGRPASGQIVRIDLATTSPAAAVAITVTDTSGPGYVTVGRCADLENGGGARTSNVNYSAGTTVTGLAIVGLDAGQMCAFTLASAHVVVDVQAELVADHQLGLLPATPARAHDSRLN